MWTENSDPNQQAITFSEWGSRITAALQTGTLSTKLRAAQSLADLTERLDAMWNDGGGAYAFAPQEDLSIAVDECVIG